MTGSGSGSGRGEGIPRGDGRPVVLVPGFLAGDQTLAVAAAWLRRIGYRPHVCGFVANVDCSDRAAERVERRVTAIHGRSGRRVALIGHSRGGHYARAIAARAPDRVSHAISLGADLSEMVGISVPTTLAVRAARRGLRLTARARADQCVSPVCTCGFTRDYYRQFPTELVRLTSIYSKGDGVVRWENQIVTEADCVEVTGSHVGLVFNRKAYRAIAQALAAPELPAAADGKQGDLMQTMTVPPLFEDLGHALATDYFFLREQLTDEQLGVLRRVREFVDDEVLVLRRYVDSLLVDAGHPDARMDLDTDLRQPIGRLARQALIELGKDRGEGVDQHDARGRWIGSRTGRRIPPR